MKTTKLLPLLCAILSTCYLTAQPTQWQSAGLGGGGAMFNPTISPFDHSEYYLVSDLSGIFHSADSGNQWETIPFQEITGESHNIKIHFTAHPDTLYSYGFTGLGTRNLPMRSVDGGKSWKPLEADPTFGEVHYIFADPDRTDRLIVSDYHNIFLSNDGGQSFDQIFSTNDFNGLHIAGVFWDDTDIYMGYNKGLLVSTDSGETFRVKNFTDDLPTNHGFTHFSGTKVDDQVTLYGVARPSEDSYGGYHPGDFYHDLAAAYRIEYGSTTGWKKQRNGFDRYFIPVFAATSTDNDEIAYVAGYNTVRYAMEVYKTENGGTNYHSIFKIDNNENISTGWMGEEGDEPWIDTYSPLGLEVAPNDPNVIILTDWMFAHGSTDGGESWHQLYVPQEEGHPVGELTPKYESYHSNGLEITSVWHLNWFDQDNVFASYTDITANVSRDGGETWSRDYTYPQHYNTTYYTLKHPENEKVYACVASVHDLYQWSEYLEDANIDGESGAILVSEDNGKTWTTLHDFGHPVIWMDVAPDHPNRFYASVVHSTQGGIYYSENYGETWKKLAKPPRTDGHPFNIQVLNDGTLVCTYSARLNSSGQFTQSSGVFVSTNNGTTWIDRSHENMTRWTKDIIVDPHDPNQDTWYACVFSHYGAYPNEVGGIYRTYDRGLNWTRISDQYAVNSLTIHPDDPNIAYIATSTDLDGLQYSENFSCTNPTFERLDDYPFSTPVRVFFNPYDHDEIWVTSFGNGLRKGQIDTNTGVNDSLNTDLLESSLEDCQVELSWKGSSSQSLVRYELERASGDSEFTTLKTFTPQSDFCDPDYSYSDSHSDVSETFSYRLKQVYSDGTEAYSTVITQEVNCAPVTTDPEPEPEIVETLEVFPNPVNNSSPYLTIRFRSNMEAVTINIVNLLGQILKTVTVEVHDGMNTVEIDVSDLPAGLYFIQSFGVGSTARKNVQPFFKAG